MTTTPETLGNYEIVESIGKGGMGEVFKAYQPRLERHVAIKTLLGADIASEAALRRFEREAKVVAALRHPNIVQIYDFGAQDGRRYIVMEYVDGKSVEELIREGTLGVRASLRIAHIVCRALAFAHKNGVIHRDIKPANIIVDREGHVRVLDFGIVKQLAEEAGDTATFALIGTPRYMSPEQAFGDPDEVDHRTDLYSLGAMLYEMLTGRPPFDGATAFAVLRKIEDDDAPAAEVSPQIDALLARALAKDPDARFASADEMAEAIARCVPKRGVEVRSLPAPPRRRRWSLRIAGAIAVLGMALWWLRPSESTPRWVDDVASARFLQRYAAPGLIPAGLGERPEAFEPEGLEAALFLHLDGRDGPAREKLKAAAAAGADPVHVALVRAHLDVLRFLLDPELGRPLLAPLREELARHEAELLRPMGVLAAYLDGDKEAAFRVADSLLGSAPRDPATFLVRSLLFQAEGQLDKAIAALDDVARLDEEFDPGPQQLYLHLIERLHRAEPELALVEGELARGIDEGARHGAPMALFARATLRAVESDWAGARRDLGELAELLPHGGFRLDQEALMALAGAIGAPGVRLKEAARELQMSLGRRESALATARAILREDFADVPEEERRELLARNHVALAVLTADDRTTALRHVEQALALGAPVEDIRDFEPLAGLRELPEFTELIRRHAK